MKSVQSLKVNLHSQFHHQNYFVHTLDEVNLNENIHNIQLEVTTKKLMDQNIKQCQICKNNLINFLESQRNHISAIQFTMYDFQILQMFLDDQSIADAFKLLNLKELTIKSFRGELSQLKQIIDIALRIFSLIESVTLEIAFLKTEIQQIHLLSSLLHLQNLKQFSMKLRQVEFPTNLFVELFENDIGSVIQKLQKIQLSFTKINFNKNRFDLFRVFEQNKLNNLLEFSLSLDYIIGNIIFPPNLMEYADNLKLFSLQISNGQFIHEIINTLKNVSKITSLELFSLKLLECDIPAKLSLDLADSMRSLQNLKTLDLKLVPQKITMKTQILKPLFSQYESIIRDIVFQNQNLETICINLENQSTKTMLDAVGFYENIQFTDFFTEKCYQHLKEIKYLGFFIQIQIKNIYFIFYYQKYKDCSYSGVNRYNATSMNDFNLFQLNKNKNLLSFLQSNQQIVFLQICEILVNNKFIQEFSDVVSNMKSLKTLEIELRELSQEGIMDQDDQNSLFNQMSSLEFIKLKVTDLRKYLNLFTNKNVKVLTLNQYNQFIKLENFILQFKVQKLICCQKAIISRLQRFLDFRQDEFTKIIVLEEGGNLFFQLLDCTVVNKLNGIQYFNDQKQTFYNFILFYKYLFHEIKYSPQQTLYDLYEQ